VTWKAPYAERPEKPLTGPERPMLQAFLDWQRATLLYKCAGLTGEQLAERAVPPSGLSLLGLVRHMTRVERIWFRRRFAGEPVEPLFGAGKDEDFERVDPARAAADYARLTEEFKLANAAVANASLDDTFIHERTSEVMSLRRVYLHMIEEYARHLGHADLLRERIDGSAGELPGRARPVARQHPAPDRVNPRATAAVSGAGGMGVVPAGEEPPAVVSLLAGRLDQDGFVATLMDLAARGWFRLTPAAGSVTSRGAAPVMCVLPAQPPAQTLTPHERRVAAHVSLRAGARGEVPVPALWDGFDSGEAEFMKGFREEVAADARQRRLTRRRIRPRRIAQLCALMLIPAGALLFALLSARTAHAVSIAAAAYFVLAVIIIGIGAKECPSAEGRAVLDRWRTACVTGQGGNGREAYAAALGLIPAVASVFARPGKNMAWSSYRGSWQQIAIEANTWPWPTGVAIMLAAIFLPILYFLGVIWLFMSGMAALGAQALLLMPAAAVTGLLVWLARRALGPRFVVFDGQVIRQWVVEGDSDSPDEYHVAVDDGIRDHAWDLDVGRERYRRLPPGTFVRARVNMRNRGQMSVDPVEPPPRRW
jgi:uncharacterized damage-inducible protein DinB